MDKEKMPRSTRERVSYEIILLVAVLVLEAVILHICGIITDLANDCISAVFWIVISVSLFLQKRKVLGIFGCIVVVLSFISIFLEILG